LRLIGWNYTQFSLFICIGRPWSVSRQYGASGFLDEAQYIFKVINLCMVKEEEAKAVTGRCSDERKDEAAAKVMVHGCAIGCLRNTLITPVILYTI
jgi:hypothetical protein